MALESELDKRGLKKQDTTPIKKWLDRLAASEAQRLLVS